MGLYYDFNLAKPELFENKEPDYHKDFTHMNAAGGHAFSLSMAKFLPCWTPGRMWNRCSRHRQNI